jgi:uncharacterized glyoxalase superfamily protein PhnB
VSIDLILCWRFTISIGRASELGDHSYVAYLHVDDVDRFHAHAIAAGAEVLKAPTDEPWRMREIGLRSPDGHRFILGQPIRPA